MEALRTLLSASSVDDPDKDSNSPEANAAQGGPAGRPDAGAGGELPGGPYRIDGP